MNNKLLSIGQVVLAVLALVIAVGALIEAGRIGDVQTMGLTGTGQSDLTTLNLSEDLVVGDDATIGDDASVGGDLDVTGSTTVGSITLGGSTINGNLVVTGTSDLQGNVSDSGGTLTFADDAMVDGAADAIQFKVQGYTTQTNPLLMLEQSDGTNVLSVSNAGNTVVTGTLDVVSTVNYGSDNLYPLGYATSGQQIVCGTTGVFTETTSVSVSGLTTVTYVLALQITDPANTAAIISVDQPTTSTVTFNSWSITPTVGTTGVNLYYCAVGNQ